MTWTIKHDWWFVHNFDNVIIVSGWNISKRAFNMEISEDADFTCTPFERRAVVEVAEESLLSVKSKPRYEKVYQ